MSPDQLHVVAESLRELVAVTEREFESRFSRPPSFVVAAPGRVNLIGEHIDYNDGFVLPMAIERYIVFAGAAREDQADQQATFHSISLNETATLALDQPIEPQSNAWANYIAGVIAGFVERGTVVPSFDAVFESNVPLGGGLSSSAALEVATATLVESLTNQTLDPTEKALLCQHAEHRFAGVPCGIMDQFSSVFGKQDELMLLDCRSQEIQSVPFAGDDITVLITNSNVKHELAGGEYAKRRAQCDAALAKLGQSTWRDVTFDDLESKDDELTADERRRARHVVGEIGRTIEAAGAFQDGDWVRVGDLMYASHDSLRDDYAVSCDELDVPVDIAREIGNAGGVLGSRMTGGGFGGCTVTLVKTENVDSVMKTLVSEYMEKTGIEPHCFASRPARAPTRFEANRDADRSPRSLLLGPPSPMRLTEMFPLSFVPENKMKSTSLWLVASLALSWFLADSSPVSAADQRPNIIVVMVDDMGFSDIGAYGSEISTPHLDALAADGVKFSQFYNTGRCCPTRASLLTGLYSHQAGVGWMTSDQGEPGYRGQLNDQCVTIAEALGEAGYFTAMTGKWHVGFEHGTTPWGRGFERSLNLPAGGLHFSNQTGPKGGTKLFLNGEEVARDDPRFDPPWYGSDLWTEQGIRFVDEAIAEEKPFFWYLAHVAPHFPCMAPEETIAKYRGKFLAGWDRMREERHQRQIDSGLIDANWKLEPRPAEIPAWDSLSQEDRQRYDDMMAIYAAMIEEVDKNIGKLVDALRQRQQLDNTLILFFSDNGGNAETGIPGKYQGDHPGDPHSNVYIGRCWAHLNNTPFRKYKHYNHEGGIATPLIAHWPAAVKPRASSKDWIETPTHLIDVMATCIDLADATYPETFHGKEITPMQGQSLRPLLTGEGTFPTRTLFWEHEGNAAIRVGDRKLVREGINGEWELFDLAADRTEQHNLAETHGDVVAELTSQWKRWANQANVLPKPKKSQAKKRKKK